MAGGPAAVLAALRAARGWAEAADAALAARGAAPARRPGRARSRNLLVYGPLALVVPLIQVVLYAGDGHRPGECGGADLRAADAGGRVRRRLGRRRPVVPGARPSGWTARCASARWCAWCRRCWSTAGLLLALLAG